MTRQVSYQQPRKACINFKNAKEFSEAHNQRIVVPKYVIKEMMLERPANTIIFENTAIIKESIADRLQAIKQLYIEKVGQKWQDKSEPIKEAVIVLDASCLKDNGQYRGRPTNKANEWVLDTNPAVQKLSTLEKALEQEFGISVFQLFIHLDEGKKDEQGKGVLLPNRNLHAHLLFDFQNKQTGKIFKPKRGDLIRMQTLTAECLGMERGKVFSKSERLEHGEYRYHMQRLEEQRKELEEQNRKIQQDIEEKKKSISDLQSRKLSLQKNVSN